MPASRRILTKAASTRGSAFELKPFAWIARTPRGPKGADFDAAVARWRELRTDDGARFDTEVRIDAAVIGIDAGNPVAILALPQ